MLIFVCLLFRAHLCEIVWRNHFHSSNILEEFLNQLAKIYDVENKSVNWSYESDIFNTIKLDDNDVREHFTSNDSNHVKESSPSDPMKEKTLLKKGVYKPENFTLVQMGNQTSQLLQADSGKNKSGTKQQYLR